jgi:hypothetical protein
VVIAVFTVTFRWHVQVTEIRPEIAQMKGFPFRQGLSKQLVLRSRFILNQDCILFLKK